MRVSSNLFLSIVFFLTLLQAIAQEVAPRPDLDYRAIRRAAVGREHEQIKTPRGTIFYKVKILRVDEHRVTIEHQDGRALLEYASIPAEWVKEFNMVEKTSKKRRSTKSNKPSVPEFDLSGTVQISGDVHSGAGVIVNAAGAYFVYTDCSVVSGNNKISIQSNDGTVLQYAKVIECAEGVPLARIQIKVAGEGIKPVALAESGAGAKLKEHQYLYPLAEKGKVSTLKVRSVEAAAIETTARFSTENIGSAIMTGEGKAIAMVLATLPKNQRMASPASRFVSRQVAVVRLDTNLHWKKVRLANYLKARKVILAFDEQTRIATAISECRLSGGKITYPSDSSALFVASSKNRDVKAIVNLHDELAKKRLKVNEKEVQRKLDSIIDSVLRRSKKQASAVSPASVSWYHRHFLTQSIAWRKRLLIELER